MEYKKLLKKSVNFFLSYKKFLKYFSKQMLLGCPLTKSFFFLFKFVVVIDIAERTKI